MDDLHIVDASTISKNLSDKIIYYSNFFKAYGFKKNILITKNPINIEESKKLFEYILQDKSLLLYLKENIQIKLNKDGCIDFYNSLFFNVLPYINSVLSIDNLKLDWDELNINNNVISIYINKQYYGDLDIFNKTYTTANPKELKELSDESRKFGEEYNSHNERLNYLSELITNPPKKDLMHKLKIYKKDPLEKEKEEYDKLLEEKYILFNKLIKIEDKYNKIVKSITDNREFDNELNKLIKDNLGFEIINNFNFPEIETYSEIEDRFEILEEIEKEEGAPTEKTIDVKFEFKSE